MQKAIQKAIEGGYERKNGSFSFPMKLNDEFDIWEYDTNAILLDPLFWQSIFKKTSCFHDGSMYRHEAKCDIGMFEWQKEWHRFIDHLASGKDIDSFFDNLLPNT